MSQDPFATGSGGSGANITDFDGALLYIYPKEFRNSKKGEGVQTQDYGEKDAVVADIHVLDGDDKGTVEENVLVFQGRLIGALRPHAGKRPYVGRLGKGKEKVKGNYPWEFTEPTDKERKLAREYHDSLPQDDEDPFAS